MEKDDVESVGSGSDRERDILACFPKVQKIVDNFNTNTPPIKTKLVSSNRGTPASSTTGRRHQPHRFGKVVPCLQGASSQSSINTIASSASKILDPVQVYCRVRPLGQNDDSCIKIIGNKSLIISSPESATGRFVKEYHYEFEQLFNGETMQQTVFDEIALPLVKDFLQGKNSLLFAYGITGSGKTYTMSGTPTETGIMPRCLDVIFNSIAEVKAMKHVFRPDHLNGFEAQTKAEAMLDRQKEISAATSNIPKTPGKNLRNGRFYQTEAESTDSRIHKFHPDFKSQRAYDTTIVPVVNKNSVYSIFITYIEIYNNFVYDLLEESSEGGGMKSKVMRMLREDVNHNVYVNGVTEVEVQSADEAFDVFNRGQRQRRIAHTTLNTESSRSHSIFNIRLVQGPLNEEGEVPDDKNVICISQLSLVDLAGSERYGRTGATGDRLKEAGNINTSLMTLRKCMETLRENQRTNSNKIIPYRDTKLTHFLKNYFEGEGRVRMVLCINPKIVDYDENLHVLTFADMTKEVQVPRPQPPPTPLPPKEPTTPAHALSKRKAVEVPKSVKRRLMDINETEPVLTGRPMQSAGLKKEANVYGLGPTFPLFKMLRCDEEHILANLRAAMQLRINNRLELHSMITTKRSVFRARLLAMERSLESLQRKQRDLTMNLDSVTKERDTYETGLRTAQFEKEELDLKIEEQERQIFELRETLENCQMEIRQREVTHMKEQEKLKGDLERERELDELRRTRQMQKEEAKLKAVFDEKEKTIEAVRQLVTHGNVPSEVSRRSRSKRSLKHDSMSTSSDSDIPSAVEREHELAASKATRGISLAKLPASSPSKHRRGVPRVSNAVRYRSRSTDNDKWLEHASGVGVCQGTVFQPIMKHKKSVSHLTKPEDITQNTTKYCLKTQQMDSDGEIETLLVKGDVMPTYGGGAQVIFTDAEALRQISPIRALSPKRKRASPLTPSRTQIIINDRGDNPSATGIGHFSPIKKSRQHNGIGN